MDDPQREVEALAQDVLGSQAEAQAWLARPALALDGRRPIELLSTPEGVTAVKDLLHRIDRGVYS